MSIYNLFLIDYIYTHRKHMHRYMPHTNYIFHIYTFKLHIYTHILVYV